MILALFLYYRQNTTLGCASNTLDVNEAARQLAREKKKTRTFMKILLQQNSMRMGNIKSSLVPGVIVPLTSGRERETLVKSKGKPYLIGC